MKVFKTLQEAISYGRVNYLCDKFFADICKYKATQMDGMVYIVDELGLLG